MAKHEQRQAKKTAAGGDDPVEAAAAPSPAVEAMRLRVGEDADLTQRSVLRDLEAAKHLAFEESNLAAAVRATELQGRAIGVFREPDPEAIRRVPDEVLVRRIAGDNEAYAEMLRDTLKNGLPKQPASPGGAVLRTATGHPLYAPGEGA